MQMATDSGLKVEKTVVDGENAVRATYTHRSWVAVFLVVWLVGWTFGCVKLVQETLNRPFELQALFMMIPFLAGEVLVSVFLLMILFGKTELTFTPSGGTVFTGIGTIGRTRTFSFPLNGEICTDSIESRGGKRGRIVYHRILVKTPGNLEEPCVVFSSPSASLVASLYDIAKEVARCQTVSVPQREVSREHAEHDRRDHALLSSPPPKHMSVSRDFEGVVHVAYRRMSFFSIILDVVATTALAALIWTKRAEVQPVVIVVLGTIALVFSIQFLYELFGKRTVTLDHGKGMTFAGLFGIGFRRRFAYSGSSEVNIGPGNIWSNGRRLHELFITEPGGRPVGICGSWSNEAKQYLAALLRNPSAIVATFEMPQT